MNGGKDLFSFKTKYDFSNFHSNMIMEVEEKLALTEIKNNTLDEVNEIKIDETDIIYKERIDCGIQVEFGEEDKNESEDNNNAHLFKVDLLQKEKLIKESMWLERAIRDRIEVCINFLILIQ